MECGLPGQMLGNESTEASYGLAHIEACHMYAYSQTQLLAGEIIGNQR